jgi:hypothetical protein
VVPVMTGPAVVPAVTMVRVRVPVVVRVSLDMVASVYVPVVAVHMEMVAAVMPQRVPVGSLLTALKKVLGVPVDVPFVLEVPLVRQVVVPDLVRPVMTLRLEVSQRLEMPESLSVVPCVSRSRLGPAMMARLGPP